MAASKAQHEVMADYIDSLLQLDMSKYAEEKLLRLRRDMVTLLQSGFVKKGLPGLFRELEKTTDVEAIQVAIAKYNCLYQLRAHIRCTLDSLPICRGVVETLVSKVFLFSTSKYECRCHCSAAKFKTISK